MQLPATLIVGPLHIQVLCDDESWQEAMALLSEDTEIPEGLTPYGYTVFRQGRIYIWPALNDSHRRLSLLHELLHVCVHLANLELRKLRPAVDLEEEFIEAVAPWLVIALVQNPDLLALFLPGDVDLYAVAGLSGRQRAAEANGEAATRRADALPVMAAITQYDTETPIAPQPAVNRAHVEEAFEAGRRAGR